MTAPIEMSTPLHGTAQGSWPAPTSASSAAHATGLSLNTSSAFKPTSAFAPRARAASGNAYDRMQYTFQHVDIPVEIPGVSGTTLDSTNGNTTQFNEAKRGGSAFKYVWLSHPLIT